MSSFCVSFPGIHLVRVLTIDEVGVLELFLFKCLFVFTDVAGYVVSISSSPTFCFEFNLCVHVVGLVAYLHDANLLIVHLAEKYIVHVGYWS